MDRRRDFVGSVPGSISVASGQLPLGHYSLANLHRHAVGRSVAMAEVLVDVAFLKSAGLIKPGMPLRSTGARFQDFKGTREFVRAHRATLTISVGALNVADLALPSQCGDLRRHLIAPQAVTDQLPVYANYADRVFEIVVARETFGLVKSMVDRQAANKDVNVANVVETIWMLLQTHARGYEAAIDRLQELRRKEGWAEVPLGEVARTLGTPRKDVFNPATAVSDSELREWLRAGPQSPLVEERLELMSGLRPTELGDAPEIYLMGSRESSGTATPILMHHSQIDALCSKLDDAASGGGSDAKGTVQREA